jgi:hypothetical protein
VLTRIALAALLAGCGPAPDVPDAQTAPGSRPSVPVPAPGSRPPPGPRPRTGEPTVAIPAGPVIAGSLPGTPGRRPSREADALSIDLPAFEIDARPYPNDPLAQPTLVASLAEASALCEARGARLCAELEWERACESLEDDVFPGGSTFDPDVDSASREGVLHLGLDAPEWALGQVPAASVRMGRTAILRGARRDAPPELHRCASRTFEVPEAAPPAAFRCCRGALPPPYPEVAMHREIRDLDVSTAELRAAMRTVPELAPYAEAFDPYRNAEGDRALARGGVDRSALAGWELAPGPFSWSPSPGEEVWVFSGSSGEATLVAAMYPLPGGRFVHAASFVLEGEVVPIAIARTPPSRTELKWSACWSCPGESGSIVFGDDAIVRVIQR